MYMNDERVEELQASIKRISAILKPVAQKLGKNTLVDELDKIEKDVKIALSPKER